MRNDTNLMQVKTMLLKTTLTGKSFRTVFTFKLLLFLDEQEIELKSLNCMATKPIGWHWVLPSERWGVVEEQAVFQILLHRSRTWTSSPGDFERSFEIHWIQAQCLQKARFKQMHTEWRTRWWTFKWFFSLNFRGQRSQWNGFNPCEK